MVSKHTSSSASSTIMDDEKAIANKDTAPGDLSPERASLERVATQNISTLTAELPETDAEAKLESDVEKTAGGPPTAAPGGTNPADFPDGGFEAWLVVAGGWCALFCSFGWINAIGVFQQYYQQNTLRAYSSSSVSWIPSMEVFMMFLGGPIFGKVFDTYGPRYILLVGSFCHVFGLMMASLSKEYYQILLSQGVISSLGASMVFYAAMGSIATWFLKNRGAAFGVMASGSSLGGVVFPIMVPRLIEQVGFGWAMRACAFMILGMLIIANFTIKSRLAPKPSKAVLIDFVRPFRQPEYTLLCFASFFFFFGTFLPFNYIILQAQKLGMSANLSSYLLSMLNAASIFGRILPGIIADRIGRFNVMIVTTAFSAIIVLALWLPAKGNAPIIIFSILYGFSSGAFVSLGPALMAQISPIREMGVRTGTFFLFVAIAGLTGNPIGGALVGQDDGDYLYLQIFCGVAMVMGTIFFTASRWVQAGFKVKVI